MLCFRVLLSLLVASLAFACWDDGISPENKAARSDLVLLAQSSDLDREGQYTNFLVSGFFNQIPFGLTVGDEIRVESADPACVNIQPHTFYILFLQIQFDLDIVYANAFHPILSTMENLEYYKKIIQRNYEYSEKSIGSIKEEMPFQEIVEIKHLQKRSSPEAIEPLQEFNDSDKSSPGKQNQTSETEDKNPFSTSPRPSASSPRTLPPARRFGASSRTLPSARPSTASSRTLPSARSTSASSRTLPTSRSRYSRILPSLRRILSTLRPSRTFPTRRTFISRSRSRLPPRGSFSFSRNLPRPRTVPRKTLPKPVRTSSRKTLPQSRGRPGKELPLRQRVPSSTFPTPRQFSSRRPPSTVSPSAMSFVHISESLSESAESRDGETVIGCPTMIGFFRVTNITRNGFNGYIHVGLVEDPMANGWMLQMKFNIPLRSVSCDTLNEVTCSTNHRDFCFVPKTSESTISQNNDLRVYFSGNFSGLRVRNIRSSVKLMGICSESQMQMRRNNASAFRDFANERPEVRESVNTEATNTNEGPRTETTTLASTVSAQRCQSSSPNGVLAGGGDSSPSWQRSSDDDVIDYNELLHKSILFFEAQRSGRLPQENRIPWRGDSDLKDGCLIGADLTGGWYSSGGNVKSTPLIAFSTTLLAWGAIDYRGSYMESGEMSNLLEQIRWATDYLIKTRTSPTSLLVQIGDYKSSSQDWSRPEESTPSSRILFTADSHKPAADVAGEVAAALAAASVLFNDTDSNYAQSCLTTAMDFYQFSLKYQRRYGFNRDAVYSYGRNHNYKEEMAWAAIWLYRATGDATFLNSAENFFARIGRRSSLFSMKQKSQAITILLAKLTGNSQYTRLADLYINWFNSRASRNSKRLLYLTSTGANMYTANAAFLALQAAELDGSEDELTRIRATASQLMATLVGVRGQGYVVGVGEQSPEQPYHRGSVCPTPPLPCTKSLLYLNEANPHVLYGALVSGVDRRGRYSDRASDSLHNRVRIDYNAGFQGLAAGILHLRSRD